MPGILKAQLFHACMGKVLRPLCDPQLYHIVDPLGDIRQCMPFLMAWIADLEEQYLISCLAKNNCPTCYADFECLGKDRPKEPRTGKEIVDTILSSEPHIQATIRGNLSLTVNNMVSLALKNRVGKGSRSIFVASSVWIFCMDCTRCSRTISLSG